MPGSATIELEIDREQPLVTLVSMIAPSPNWFVGVHGQSLIEGGNWTTEKVIVLFPYDAGTDDGATYESHVFVFDPTLLLALILIGVISCVTMYSATYESPDRDTRPCDRIHPLDHRPVLNVGAVAPFGIFTFRRIS